VGGLFADLRIYNSQFSQNRAVGNGANDNKPALCAVVNNNGQNQVGSGGNGGAIYSDGQSVNVLLCGDKIVNNSAGVNADGGGLFFTSNDWQGTLSIIDTEMTGNTGGYWTSVATGSTKNAGTAVGTNCKSLTIQNSTLQGLP
jgi:predicted outer membrane repeat protein